MTTIIERIAAGADAAPAILAPERPALTHAGLRQLMLMTAARLNALGIGRGDRVAIVLPNGPEMATAFVSVAAAATTAPLNPAYRADELDFYLTDIGARAILVGRGEAGPSVAVAARLGIPVFRLDFDPASPAGIFSIDGPAGDDNARPGLAEADDIALLLHTSGTTSRPKLVPLTHANLAASARHIGRTLRLEPGDRCLNIMPLFHIHGLIAAVLSSLAAGASVTCTPGFNALSFFRWLDEAKPTWYTAVPTMHQAILARAPRNAESVADARLRFIRSSSSSLPPQVMAELEATFRCPVIESYGMTEAAHQMASNPLPPATRKPGSVGPAAGPEVAIMAEDGSLMPADTVGEIVNRGGEKISPREVDEVLMDMPAIAQVVTFAMPHDKLGEEVAAAVVLREGNSASEQAIRDFAATRLADFKVPRKILILDEIPKGATGKLQRIGLAQKLGLGG